MYSRIYRKELQPLLVPLFKTQRNPQKYILSKTFCWTYFSKNCKYRITLLPTILKCKTPETLALYKNHIHTTKPLKALPPIIWVVLRPLLKFAAVVTGRGVRKWWASLPQNKKSYIVNEVRKNWRKIIAGPVLFTGLVYVYYLVNLVEDPITKRKKFLIFSDTQINQMSMIESELIMENYKGKVITSGYRYQYVLNTAHRILQANLDLYGVRRPWQVLLVDDEETVNACVLPSGQIFVFTGILKALSNEDQLAAILAHEMAHAFLSHSAEVLSATHLIEMLMILPLVALWTFFPDSVALMSHYFTEYMSSVLFKLPFSRSIETEADSVGLEMMARACYDPRQASAFWKKMEQLSDEEVNIEWLSTHPSHTTRYQSLDALMPKAFKTHINFCSKSTMNPRSG